MFSKVTLDDKTAAALWEVALFLEISPEETILILAQEFNSRSYGSKQHWKDVLDQRQEDSTG